MSSPRKKSTPELVQDFDLDYLVSVFANNVFTSNATDPEKVRTFDDIQQKCVELFDKDYIVKVIDNDRGKLSATYPNKIVSLALPADNGDSNDRDSNDHQRRTHELRMLMQKSRVARARTRFVVPVILYDGKHICRSATLSGGIEIYTRALAEYLCGPSRCSFSQFRASLGLVQRPTDSSSAATDELIPESPESIDEPDSPGLLSTPGAREEYEDLSQGAESTSNLPQDDASLHAELRKEDIELLRLLSVRRICDLMVEGKKEKFCLKMTSSEKVDKFGRYRDFTIFKLPYPGCEFFEKYVKQLYNPEGLYFDWTQHFVDVELEVPETSISSELNIDWKNYKHWDLVELTKNYLKFLLKVIIDGDSSLLVHCISGWDRTALFISMLRLSLWADNKIHQNLSALEMAYLTAAYDWFLFSHNLPNRVQKSEEIFFFCFNMLKYISTEEFSTLSLENTANKITDSIGTAKASGERSQETDASCSVHQIAAAGTRHTGQETLQVDATSAGPSVQGDTSHDASCESTLSSRGPDAPRDFSAPTDSNDECGRNGWQIIKDTGSTDSSLSSDVDSDQNTTASSIRRSSDNVKKPGGSEDSAHSSKDFSLKLRRERLEEVRRIVCRTYINVRAAVPHRPASTRCLNAIARTFSVTSAREGSGSPRAERQRPME
ncbi:phosphatidylinositol-3,5-bisphosphate 3-phosphatase MTMR14-like [Dermacentor albipictus]|uniref:phosphatidylinositol-3,5-bisphosphate 3-phosphatase MTMR14-like n=1 Tax=Dermacentor albipictus TaxID=60249 RepID=UPI0031FD33DB